VGFLKIFQQKVTKLCCQQPLVLCGSKIILKNLDVLF